MAPGGATAVERISTGPDRIALRLAAPELLFQPPQADPLHGGHVDLSGLDLVLQTLKSAYDRRDSFHTLELHLPADAATRECEARLRVALDRWVGARLREIDADGRLMALERRQAWTVGTAFLATCLTLSALLDWLAPGDGGVRTLLRESLVIAGWVGLWRPLELTLYEWWPNRFRKGLWRQIADMSISVVPEQTDGSAIVFPDAGTPQGPSAPPEEKRHG